MGQKTQPIGFRLGITELGPKMVCGNIWRSTSSRYRIKKIFV